MPEPDEGESPIGEWPIRTTGYLPGGSPHRPGADRPVPLAADGQSRDEHWTPAPLDGLVTSREEDPPAPPGGLRTGPEEDYAVPREELRPGPEAGTPDPAPATAGESPLKDAWRHAARVTGRRFAPGPNVDLDSSLPVSPPTSLGTSELELPELEVPEEEIAVVEDADAAFEEYQRLRAKARLDASRSPGDALITGDREGD